MSAEASRLAMAVILVLVVGAILLSGNDRLSNRARHDVESIVESAVAAVSGTEKPLTRAEVEDIVKAAVAAAAGDIAARKGVEETAGTVAQASREGAGGGAAAGVLTKDDVLEIVKAAVTDGGGASPYRENTVPAALAAGEKNVHQWEFPSVSRRVDYYMGAWADENWVRTHLAGPRVCKMMKDRVLVYKDKDIPAANQGMILRTLEAVKREQAMKTPYIGYANDTCDVMGATEGLTAVIIQWGDHRAEDAMYSTIPVVTKVRPAVYNAIVDRSTKFNIIWPLTMQRHFQTVDNLRRGDVKDTPWEEKKPILIWRGGPNAVLERSKVINMWREFDRSMVQVSFTHVPQFDYSGGANYLHLNVMRGNGGLNFEDYMTYKYLLVLEGNDVATQLKWALYSDSVVFMARPKVVSFAMEDLLVPWVHYVPVADDHMDLADLVRWARANDARCRQIAQQATEFMRRLWASDQAQAEYKEICQQLAQRYRDAILPAVNACLLPP